MVTKDVYQAVLDRISNKEGIYLQSAYSTSIASIQNATREGMALAPDETSAPEKTEIGFHKKSEDLGVEAAQSWMSAEPENTDTEDYFAADAYRKCMDKITFTEEDGKEQAEQILEDLGIDGMGIVDSGRTVWFPKGACSENNGLGLGSDALWQGNLDKGVPGYLYFFQEA